MKKVACVCALTHHRNLLPFWRSKSFGFCTSNSETHPVSECLSTKNINQINMCIYIYIYPIQIHHFSISAVQNSGFCIGETTVSFVFFGQLKFSQLRNGTVTFLGFHTATPRVRCVLWQWHKSPSSMAV